MTNKQKTYVLYHASCLDGFGAALCAWKHLRDEAIYIPCQYGNAVPEMKIGSRVFILDFSFPRDIMVNLIEKHRVTCLDHHKTAQEALLGLGDIRTRITFDMNKSGAMLAWEYFNPGEKPPVLIEILQDRDLWLWERDDTKAVTAALKAIGFDDFNKWKPLLDDNLTGITKLQSMGEAILKDQEQTINSHVKNSYIGNLPNLDDFDLKGKDLELIELIGWVKQATIPMVNATTLISEICHALLDKYPELPVAGSMMAGNKSIYSLSVLVLDMIALK
jgi:oligoribonuclease NrnB/cAMP/cGMP phosphodiesterase (DHH superfamily)